MVEKTTNGIENNETIKKSIGEKEVVNINTKQRIINLPINKYNDSKKAIPNVVRMFLG